MTQISPIWARLRTLRSSAPLPDKNPQRRATFLSAMVQFEELAQAAATVGPSSRPLLLFYALSQAGRAIVASRQPGQWRCKGHGVTFRPDGAELLERRVRVEPGTTSSYQQVSTATGSPVAVGGSCSVAELCASLPELANLPALTAGRPRALLLHPVVQSGGPVFVLSRKADGWVFNLPVRSPDEISIEHLAPLLKRYPTTSGWGLAEPPMFQPTPATSGWGHGVRLRWEVPAERGNQEYDRRARLLEVAPAYLKEERYWVRPTVGDQPALVSPLMVWWQLLFALSMLARYEPDTWVAALDLNNSTLAVPLEELLDDALASVPHLVLNELLKVPYLTPTQTY